MPPDGACVASIFSERRPLPPPIYASVLNKDEAAASPLHQSIKSNIMKYRCVWWWIDIFRVRIIDQSIDES